MEIRPVGAELFYAYWRADGRTDMTQLIVALRSFAYARKAASVRHEMEEHILENENGKVRQVQKDLKKRWRDELSWKRQGEVPSLWGKWP